MIKKRVFISFDYDHDEALRNLLVAQSAKDGSPFYIKDRSIKEPLTGNWQWKVHQRMDNVDVVAVICGRYTHLAKGVATELKIARDKKKPYFLLQGYSKYNCTKPTTALPTDTIYAWDWNNLKILIHGKR